MRRANLRGAVILLVCLHAAACAPDREEPVTEPDSATAKDSATDSTASEASVDAKADATKDATSEAGDSSSADSVTDTIDSGATDTLVDALLDTTVADTISADTGTPDTGTPDTGTPDTGTPDTGASDTGSFLDAAGDVLPTGTNYCTETGAVASATTTYAGWEPTKLNDGNLGTSWFAASATCTGTGTPITCPGDTAAVTITLAGDRNVGRVYIYGNREFSTGYDVLSGHLEIKTASGTVAFSKSFTLSAPDGDIGISVSPAVSNARSIRFVIDSAESDGPGIAEIAAFAP